MNFENFRESIHDDVIYKESDADDVLQLYGWKMSLRKLLKLNPTPESNATVQGLIFFRP